WPRARRRKRAARLARCRRDSLESDDDRWRGAPPRTEDRAAVRREIRPDAFLAARDRGAARPDLRARPMRARVCLETPRSGLGGPGAPGNRVERVRLETASFRRRIERSTTGPFHVP